MRWLATICYPVLALFLFPAHAFGDSPFKISGIVLEYGSDRPIGGAQVKLYGDEDVLTTTNAEGKFEFHLESAGTYTVAFSKAGYRVISVNSSGSMASLTLILDDAHPAGTMRMRMALPATLSGAVFDDVTRKPVAGLRVSIMRETLAGWSRILAPTMPPVVTDAQGHLIQKTLTPGKYAVRIELKQDRILQSFTEKDRDLIEEDYDQATFPGGGDADAASSVDLASGGTIDLGNLMAKKTSYYGVEVAFPPSVCDSAATVQVQRIDHSGALNFNGNLGEVPCGKDFLIRSLKAGEYTIQAWMKESDGPVRYASASVTIRDHAPKVTLALTPNVDLYGRISVEKDAAPIALETIRIQLQSAARLRSEHETWPDEIGNFRLPDIQGTGAAMQVVGLPQPFYVKSMRYNGVPVIPTAPSIFFSLDANAATHRLEILIDDKPAALFGKVMKGDQAAEHPYVVLLRWPRFGQPVAVSGDANGEFQFAGLTPGEYRVLAVSENDQENIHDPDVLARVLAKAQKVELGPSGVQRVTLELAK